MQDSPAEAGALANLSTARRLPSQLHQKEKAPEQAPWAIRAGWRLGVPAQRSRLRPASRLQGFRGANRGRERAPLPSRPAAPRGLNFSPHYAALEPSTR